MPAPDTDTPKTKRAELVEMFIFGAFVAALFTIPFSIKAGRTWERAEFDRIGTSMDQAQKRHREAMGRANKRLDFVHQCVDELDHVDAPSDVLGFCANEAQRHW